MTDTELKSLFNKGDDIWTIDHLELRHANVEEVCKDDDDILYRVDKEIYTDGMHPHPHIIIGSENAYTEETALAKMIEKYNAVIEDTIENVITLGNIKRELRARLKKLREENKKW